MISKNFILLAEDDEDDQELIQMAFSKITADHDIKIVGNGAEALRVLSGGANLPCLIILDLNMPLLNGMQTLKALREDPKFRKVPIVILTTSDSDDIKATSYSQGAIDYFVKPASMKEFVMTAEKILSYCR